jgi:hypothetical protein
MIDQTDESSLEQPSIVQEARVIWLVIFGYNCPRPAVPCESVAVSFPASKLIVRSSSVQKRRGLLTHSPHSLTHSHSLTHTHSLTHSLKISIITPFTPHLGGLGGRSIYM